MGILAIVLVCVIPYQISRIMELRSRYSTYDLTQVGPRPLQHTASHVVLVGAPSLSSARVLDCCQEMLHPDHAHNSRVVHVTVISATPPSATLQQLLHDPDFAQRTTYIQGSLVEENAAPVVAQRAKLDQAQGIFIFAKSNCSTWAQMLEADHATLLQTLAVLRMTRKISPNNECPQISVQIHCRASQDMFRALGIKHIVCSQSNVSQMLARNCICPAFSTLFTNFTTSSSETSSGLVGWKSQYLRGASHEMYLITLPSPTVVFGLTFGELASRVYHTSPGIILFAIVISNTKVWLNPGKEYVCTGHEQAFVIAQSQEEADKIEHLTRSQLARPAPRRLTKERCHERPLFHYPAQEELQERNETLAKNQDTSPVSKRVASGSHVFISSMATRQPMVCFFYLALLESPELELILDHLREFITPLRAPGLATQAPIILCTLDAAEAWQVEENQPKSENASLLREFLHAFDDVYLSSAQWQNLTSRTLVQTGIETAQRIVLWSVGSKGSASIMALYQHIVHIIGKPRACQIYVECLERSHFHYISQSLHTFQGWFVEDDASVSSSSSSVSTISVKEEQHHHLAFVSGSVYSSTFCDNLLLHHFFNPMIHTLVQALVCPSANPNTVFTVPVPLNCQHQTFSWIFHTLLASDGLLCLGLYRQVSEHSSNSNDPLTFAAPYGMVVMNPHDQDIVTNQDLLYVVAKAQPMLL